MSKSAQSPQTTSLRFAFTLPQTPPCHARLPWHGLGCELPSTSTLSVESPSLGFRRPEAPLPVLSSGTFHKDIPCRIRRDRPTQCHPTSLTTVEYCSRGF